MNIRGKEKDIVNISLGHEAESFACEYVASHTDDNESKSSRTASKLLAYEAGFVNGIKFLANYLKEYDIQIEIHDEIVKTTNKEDWYSGEVVEN